MPGVSIDYAREADTDIERVILLRIQNLKKCSRRISLKIPMANFINLVSEGV